MQLSTLLVASMSAAVAYSKILYAGVNESGGEFSVYSQTSTPGTGLPGRFGVDYAFINKATVDTFIAQDKINLFRVAFLLERMCPLSYGLGAKFNETHFGFFKDAIDYITDVKGAYALFDPHNYMRYNNPSQQPMTGSIIGDTADPKAATTQQFAAFWGELAKRFVNNKRVIFGLMNEPHDMSTALLLKNNQAAIDAIRKTGAKQLITVPGNAYTGGHAWTKAQGGEPSSNFMNKIVDPLKNTAIEIHEYLDSDFSGSKIDCVQSYPANMGPLTDWLKTNNLKAIVAEIGGSNTTACANLLNGAFDYMEANSEYIGWAAWSAGPLWGSNAPCCGSGNLLGSLEPGSKAGDGGPSLYDTVWNKVFVPRIPNTLIRDGRLSGLA